MPIKLNKRVSHPSFGEGAIVNTKGNGCNALFQVNSESAGSRQQAAGS